MNTKSTMILAAALAACALGEAPQLPAQQFGQPLAKEAVLSALTSKLDTKKSKVGDPVTAKTINAITLNDGTVLPSHTLITGKLTQVQSKAGGTPTLAIEFDQIEKKGAAPIPVRGTIAAIAPLPDLGHGGGAAANDLPQRGTAAQNAAMTGQSMNPSNTEEPIAAGSSIKGIELKTTPTADGSSVLESTGKDIKLESGTRLEIGLAATH
jgi:hypothetical protein